MKKLTLSFLLSLCCSLLMATESCDKLNQSAVVHAQENDIAQTCSSDADCAVVKADCCGCNQGGKQKAMSIKDSKIHINALNEKCKDIMCIQSISKDQSCTQKEACEQNKCILK